MLQEAPAFTCGGALMLGGVLMEAPTVAAGGGVTAAVVTEKDRKSSAVAISWTMFSRFWLKSSEKPPSGP